MLRVSATGAESWLLFRFSNLTMTSASSAVWGATVITCCFEPSGVASSFASPMLTSYQFLDDMVIHGDRRTFVRVERT